MLPGMEAAPVPLGEDQSTRNGSFGNFALWGERVPTLLVIQEVDATLRDRPVLAASAELQRSIDVMANHDFSQVLTDHMLSGKPVLYISQRSHADRAAQH